MLTLMSLLSGQCWTSQAPWVALTAFATFATLILGKKYLEGKRKKNFQYSFELPDEVGPNEGKIRRSHLSKSLILNTPENFQSLYELLHWSAKRYGDRECLGWREVVRVHEEIKEIKTSDGEVEKKKWQFYELGHFKWLNYNQLVDTTLSVGRGLTEIGCETRKTRVAIYCNTRKEWQFVLHGCFSQNIGVVTVYATLGEEGLVSAMEECSIEYLFTSSDLLPMVKRISQKLPMLKNVIYCDEAKQADLEALKQVDISTYSLNEVIELGSKVNKSPIPPAYNDVAFTMYTSGTTGAPKGVMITHGNLLSAIGGITKQVRPELSDDEYFLAFLPLAHVLELIVENALLYWGFRLGYGSPRTLTETNLRNCNGDLKELRPTVMAGVPAVWETIRRGAMYQLSLVSPFKQKLFWAAFTLKTWLAPENCRVPILDDLFFNKIRSQVGGRLGFVLSGGAALSKDTQVFMRNTVCCPFVQGYGLTETCGMSNIMPPYNLELEVVGQIVPCVEIKLVDIPEMNYYANSNPPRGEILLRGGPICQGYYKQPKQTAEAFLKDGWFATGDVGEWKPNGLLSIIDRKKNLVKLSSGEYIALERLENIYGHCEYVEKICVHAESAMEQPVAIVLPPKRILDDSSYDKTELQQKVLKSLLTLGRQAGLKSIELVSGVVIAEDEWTPENDLLTAALKLKRQNIFKAYQQEIRKVSRTK